MAGAIRVLGIDACRAGWVAIELRDGGYASARLHLDLADLLSDVDEGTTVGIDMPLGLLDTGWRAAETLAANRIGARRSSVFRVPPRPVWKQPEYRAANALCRRLTGAGFSVQAFGLRLKLLEANACFDAARFRLFEVHPEVSFQAMAGADLAYPKHTWAGHNQRRRLLAAAGVEVPDDLGDAGRAGPDDVLDAAAVAWSAHRIATGRATSLPDPPERNERGQALAIWY
jgi:predicted RNase H-like nuclease